MRAHSEAPGTKEVLGGVMLEIMIVLGLGLMDPGGIHCRIADMSNARDELGPLGVAAVKHYEG